MKTKLLVLLVILGGIESSFSKDALDLNNREKQCSTQGLQVNPKLHPADSQQLNSSIGQPKLIPFSTEITSTRQLKQVSSLAASCSITSPANSITSLVKKSWGQSFEASCTGYLTNITFYSVTAVSSGVTLLIKNGTDCSATTIHTQNIGAIIDGENSVTISSLTPLMQGNTYYFQIVSSTDSFQLRFNTVNQVTGHLSTYLDTTTDTSACDWNFGPGSGDYDMNFSVTITDNTLGIEEQIADNSVKISPNPSNGLVNIDLKDLKDVSIKVFNISGQKVYQKNNINSSTHQFELKGASPGVYIVQVNTNEKQLKYKLIIK